jgi:hypothetical protein
MAHRHGGYRPGSGRKPGIPNSKTLEIRDRAAREGNAPLEVMLSIMKERLATGDQDGALVAANMAAPYMHSRLAATEVKMDAKVRVCVISSEPMTAAEWLATYGRNDAEPLSAGP